MSQKLSPLVPFIVVAVCSCFFSACLDFNVDEIWSMRTAASVDSWSRLIVSTPHDNNHILNSLVLRFLSQLGVVSPFFIRLPQLILSLLSLYFWWRVTSALGKTVQNQSTALLASSVILPAFIVEARGYAWLLFLSLLAVSLIQQLIKFNKRAHFISLTIVLILLPFTHPFGEVATLIFLPLYIKLFPNRSRFYLIALTLPSLFVVGVFYLAKLYVAGGASGKIEEVFTRVLLIPYGIGGIFFYSEIVAYILAALAFILLIVGIFSFKRKLRILFTFLAFAPLFVLLLREGALFERYFLSLILIEILALSKLYEVYSTSASIVGKRILYTLFLTLLSLNLIQTTSFLRDGRGDYRRAIYEISQEIRSQQEFLSVLPPEQESSRILLDFYRWHSNCLCNYAASLKESYFIILDKDKICHAGFTTFGIYPSSWLSGESWRICKRQI
jgi:hypothetical protein